MKMNKHHLENSFKIITIKIKYRQLITILAMTKRINIGMNKMKKIFLKIKFSNIIKINIKII